MASNEQWPATQQVFSKPAPSGGLNARDPIAAMPETDAVALVNWLPDTYGVRCRKGYREWAINFPSNNPVQGICAYAAPQDTFPGGTFLDIPTVMPGKLFAATKAGIYDVTTSTNAPTLSRALTGGALSGWIHSVMLTNSAGSFLLVASETDGYYYYDGAAWAYPTFGGGAGQVAGADPHTFVHVSMWKRRAWFVLRDSTKALYLPVDSITGAGSLFDFGPLFKHGGHLAYIANWTIDAGEGIDDFLVAVGSNGDVLVYKGTDPASLTTFSLVGSWYVGQIPVGRRAYTQYGGDLVIVSSQGVFPVSYVTRGGTDILVASAQEYSSKIRTIMGQDLRSSFTVRGWQVLMHPSERVMNVSVPDYGSVARQQYAISTSVNQWCIFNNIPVYCYGTCAGYAFAGTLDGKVLLLYNGQFDNVAYGATQGQGIPGAMQLAFSSFGTPAMEKQFLMVRAVFLSADVPNVLVDIGVNYDAAVPTGSPSYIPSTAAVWNTSLWNSAIWGGAQKVYSEWATVNGIGFAGGAALVTVCVGDTTLTSVDYMVLPAGPL